MAGKRHSACRDPQTMLDNEYKRLERLFERWHELQVNGGSDPNWADGCNMNLIRNQIIYSRKNIDQLSADEHRKDLYYRPLPPIVDNNYMAKPKEIREKAKAVLDVLEADPNYQFLCKRVPQLDPKTVKQMGLNYTMSIVTALRHAIEHDDLVAMRRQGECTFYTQCFEQRAQEVRDIKPPENQQLDMFTMLHQEPDEDEGECEYSSSFSLQM